MKMKIHYINILLFALPLNILVNTRKNPSITQKIPITRLLCECELYAPANYDNDSEMKKVMHNFSKQTQQRFEEYDERMKTTRQRCKEQCDKDIQKIILKEKIGKQMAEHFSSLENNLNTNDIPTCVCEKSMADRTEKFCLNCGVNVGGGVTLSSGVLGGIGEAALSAWKPTAISTAIQEALKAGAAKVLAAGTKAGEAMGIKTVIAELEKLGVLKLCPQISESFFRTTHYTNAANIAQFIHGHYTETCELLDGNIMVPTACKGFQLELGIHLPNGSTLGTPAAQAIPTEVGKAVEVAKGAAAKASKDASERVTAAITKNQTALLEAEFNSSITSIYASIIAIVVIVLIMVIIYLILRYRRKKKMKKKLQYIKLLED
ncbi:PIR protein, putative [Plasmodium sp. gorilla clade G1]|nr:PIR protein, putative [Plasmodium sp. gorilla clade G1]